MAQWQPFIQILLTFPSLEQWCYQKNKSDYKEKAYYVLVDRDGMVLSHNEFLQGKQQDDQCKS